MPNNFATDPSCVALWRFESVLTEDSIGTNTLTNYGVVADATSGNFQEGLSAAKFDKASLRYLKIDDANLSSTFPFKNGTSNNQGTFCFFIKPTSADLTGVPAIISKLIYGTKFSFAIDIRAGVLCVTWGYGTGGTSYETWSIRTLTADHYYHVCISLDNINKIGVAIVYDITAGTRTTHPGLFTHTMQINTTPITIGVEGELLNYLDGWIDKLVVFNRLLNNPEMDQIRQGIYNGPYNLAIPNLNSGDLYDDFEGGSLSKWSPATGAIISGMTGHCWSSGTVDNIAHSFPALTSLTGSLQFQNNAGISYGVYDLISFYSGSTQLFAISRMLNRNIFLWKGSRVEFGEGITFLPLDAIIRTLYFNIVPGNPGVIQIWLGSVLQIDMPFYGNALPGDTIDKIVIGYTSYWQSKVLTDNVYLKTLLPLDPCRSITTCQSIPDFLGVCISLTTCQAVPQPTQGICRSITTCSNLSRAYPGTCFSKTICQGCPLNSKGLFLTF